MEAFIFLPMTATALISTITTLYPGCNWQAIVFTKYCGKWTPNKNIRSTIRKDNDASLRIFMVEDGALLAYDYGRGKAKNVWQYVHEYHVFNHQYKGEFSIPNVVALINSDMKLGLESDDIFNVPQVDISVAEFNRTLTASKSSLDIGIYQKDWCDVDHDYWTPQGISLDCCTFFGVGASAKVCFKYENREWYDWHMYKRSDPIYYYHFLNFEDESKFKLLRPFAKDPSKKWRGNIDQTDMSVVQGYKQAPLSHEYIFLTSSLKDCMALRMCGHPAMALHGEGYYPSDAFVAELRSRYKYIFLLYDNDTTGRLRSEILTSRYNFDGELFMPESKFSNGKITKDPSDINLYNGGDIRPLYNLLDNFILNKK